MAAFGRHSLHNLLINLTKRDRFLPGGNKSYHQKIPGLQAVPDSAYAHTL